MSKAARLLALCLLAFGMASLHAANFSKNSSSYLQVQGSSARYTLSPQNTGSLQFPNTGWQIVGNAIVNGVTMGKTQNLPVPVGASLPATAKVVISPKSMSKALVNPWAFVASAALQNTLGYLAEEACVRIAGGQMVNTGGLWEECFISNEAFPPTIQWLYNSTDVKPDPLQACKLKYPDFVYQGTWAYSVSHAVITTETTAACYITQTTISTGQTSTNPSGQVNGEWRCADGSIPSSNSASGICSVSQVKKWRIVDDNTIVQNKIEQELKNNTSLQNSVVTDLYENGQTFEDVGPVELIGPASVNAGQPVTVEKTNPDGSIETSTQQFVRNYTYAGDTVTHVSTTTVNVTNNSGNTTTSTTTVFNDSPAAQPQEVKLETCGLPGKPACKIDETGTPEADAMDAAAVEAASAPLKTCLQDPVSCLPTLPDLNWTFALPTGCSPIPLAGFDPFITSIDICEFQPIFHDLMSMVWAAVGLFLAAGMMFKEANGG